MSAVAQSEMRQIIGRLSHEAAVGASPSVDRDAAARTGGVPVYADMGGVLVIMPDCSVLYYNPETDRVNPVDDCWRVVALVKAAKKFRELQQLRPVRPDNAVTCAQCGGEGVVLGRLDCGVCFGTGWTLSSR
jgi:hypothetical protein